MESKFFDAKRELRVVAAQARKRKAAEKAAGDGQTVKRARTTKGARTTVTQDVDAGNVSKDDAVTRADGNVDTPSVLPEPTSANPTNSPEDIQAVAAAKHLYETERRALYEKIPTIERKRGKRNVDEIEPALDDMINAGTRVGISCSRAPAMIYFRQGLYGQFVILKAQPR